ncbi:Uncharacterised protein [Enterobacter cloacae]|uniref:Uncharacterized protein n=1 Tax=Enterobacter cloacae TaxID=550 RepID=A0A377M416_ENTCL|nr:Uncharacterised protein [Enterobacter cloacae]
MHLRLGTLLLGLRELTLGVEHVDKAGNPLPVAIAGQVEGVLQRIDGLRQTRFTLLIGAVTHQRILNIPQRGQYRLAIIQHRRPLLRTRHFHAGDQSSALEDGNGDLRTKTVEVAASSR